MVEQRVPKRKLLGMIINVLLRRKIYVHVLLSMQIPQLTTQRKQMEPHDFPHKDVEKKRKRKERTRQWSQMPPQAAESTFLPDEEQGLEQDRLWELL